MRSTTGIRHAKEAFLRLLVLPRVERGDGILGVAIECEIAREIARQFGSRLELEGARIHWQRQGLFGIEVVVRDPAEVNPCDIARKMIKLIGISFGIGRKYAMTVEIAKIQA